MEEIYYIYHIPNKKIGVTRDLNNRVTLVQGYKPGEYEVLDSSSDINYISTREIELQKFYGYKVDRTLYKNLVNKNRHRRALNLFTNEFNHTSHINFQNDYEGHYSFE